ncbi:MAG: hypothetical protein WBL50_28025 [Candidatus Acidiferrum sp.]
MTNLSLARIMYGTSQEYHSAGAHTHSLAPLMNQSSTEVANNSARAPETLGELLHRAWISLSGKR